LNESVRVWLVASETQVYSDRVTSVVTDLNGGLWSPFSMRTARFSTPGGTLHVGNRVNFVSPWQPWQGFAFLYDWIVRDTFSDPGVADHPHTGAYIPIRAEFESTTAGPNASLAVPPMRRSTIRQAAPGKPLPPGRTPGQRSRSTTPSGTGTTVRRWT